jgi:Domain of unknown function (DUF5925)/ATPase family associated with various cellular activities (AAA)
MRFKLERMTTTEDQQAATVRFGARPLQTLISAQRVSVTSMIDIALAERVMDGSLPYVWARYSTQTGEFSRLEEDLPRYLPTDAVVTRICQSTKYFEVFAEGTDYALRVESGVISVQIEVASATHDRAREIGDLVAAQFPTATRNPDEVEVLTWRSKKNADVETSAKTVAVPAWRAICENYPAKTSQQLAELMGFSPDGDERRSLGGRIILWHGSPGTGKTNAIRALMREWSGWCQPELLVDPELVFARPDYLFEVMAQPARKREDSREPSWRLLIAEDADRYLQPTTHLRDNPALDRLLNVADGILGQGCKVIILLTTNSNLASLHPALTRPGRCLAITEFEKFDPAGARSWINGRAPSPSGSKSLAELYELVGTEKPLGRLQAIRPGQYL